MLTISVILKSEDETKDNDENNILNSYDHDHEISLNSMSVTNFKWKLNNIKNEKWFINSKHNSNLYFKLNLLFTFTDINKIKSLNKIKLFKINKIIKLNPLFTFTDINNLIIINNGKTLKNNPYQYTNHLSNKP